MSDPLKKYSIKTDFTLLSLLLIPVAVAVNFAAGQLALVLQLPFYLDTIGTILAAMLCGPWVGGLAGLVTNLILGISDPIFFPYAIVNVAVGLVTGFCARRNGFGSWWKWVISIFVMALASVLTAVPITVLVFGGITDSGSSLITATMLAAGVNLWLAVTITDLIFTVLDRIISVVLTWLLINVIPKRMLIRFPCGENYINSQDMS